MANLASGEEFFHPVLCVYRLAGVRCLRRRIVEAEAEEARLKEELENVKAEQAQKNLEMEVNDLVRHGAANSWCGEHVNICHVLDSARSNAHLLRH